MFGWGRKKKKKKLHNKVEHTVYHYYTSHLSIYDNKWNINVTGLLSHNSQQS